jgi:sugar phosphate isomerase/epimerase
MDSQPWRAASVKHDADAPISNGSREYDGSLKSTRSQASARRTAGLEDAKFTTNVGTTETFDPTSPNEEQRELALSYLRSRVDITSALGRDSIMAGPFLYPYGVHPDKLGWSDAIQDWWRRRWPVAVPIFKRLAVYASTKGVKLAIEPVKNWETLPPNMVSEALNFCEHVGHPQCGVTIDTAQVVMESQGPKKFRDNVARATDTDPDKNRLHYVHISAPDRGAIHDSWIPWDITLREIEPVYRGPYLIEIFNAIPPFDSSMRMTRRRFWRQGEDKKGPDDYDAYHIAGQALEELKEQIASVARACAS